MTEKTEKKVALSALKTTLKKETAPKSSVISPKASAEGADAKRKIDSHGRVYATGRRKDSIARVWLKPGKGKITVNARQFEDYFVRPTLRMIMNQPFVASGRTGSYDVICTVKGGGLSGQAGALRFGISRALVYFEPELRKVLKVGGFLTRDSRTVERKKYGRRKARRSFQFSKR